MKKRTLFHYSRHLRFRYRRAFMAGIAAEGVWLFLGSSSTRQERKILRALADVNLGSTRSKSSV